MQKIALSLLTTLLAITAYNCQRDPISIPSDDSFNVIKPELHISVEKVSATKATVKAEITQPGNVNILGYGCVWDTDPAPTLVLSSKVETAGKPPKEFIFAVAGLLAETSYYMRVFLIFAKDTIYFDYPKFQTLAHWVKLPDYPGSAGNPAAFFINGTAYFGAGHASFAEFWALDINNGTWNAKADNLYTAGRADVAGFAINGTGYFGTGVNPGYQKAFYAYDTLTNAWSPSPDYGGEPRNSAIAFTIDSIAYVGVGQGASGDLNDFWAYNPRSKVWSEVEPLPTAGRLYANSFVINHKAYVGFGRKGDFFTFNDLWEFNPTPSQPGDPMWRKMKDGPPARWAGFGFSANGKGYIGGGGHSDFWEFDPSVPPNGAWQVLTYAPPGGERAYTISLSLGDRGMILGGSNSIDNSKDCWIFNP